jgi:hypothetical protein
MAFASFRLPYGHIRSTRTTDISDRPGMSEECDFRTISEVPQSEPRASGRAGVSFTGQSIGGRNSDT